MGDVAYNPIADVKIYQINVGGPDPREGMQYRLGQKVKPSGVECNIINIIRRESNYHFFGKIAYEVWAKITDDNSENKGKEFIFKYFEGLPVHVTQEVPSSLEENQQIINHENA